MSILLTACNAAGTSSAPTLLKVAGATSMKPLLTELAAAYSAKNPRVTFDIQEGGSQLGQTLVETGQVDIGMVSWSPPELGQDMVLTPIAQDGIAVILRADNSLAGFSLPEIHDIFNGRVLNWQEVDGPPLPIQVISREEGSGTRQVFESLVMENHNVTPTAIVLPSSQAVVDFVAENPNAIGYVSTNFVDERIHAIPIEDASPMPENIAAGRYGLIRDLSLITAKDSKKEVGQFIQFIFSPAGQDIVTHWKRQ